MKVYASLALGVLSLLGMAGAWAASPAGTWTVYGPNQQAESVITLTEVNGVVNGRISKIYNATGNPVCTQCTGELQNKPLVGLPIIWDVKKTSETVWSDGKILAPKRGKIFSCNMTLSSDGKTLTVKIGGALGKTQTWARTA